MTDDRPTIRALDPSTVDRIAAGEVVERPASVVKELVENALDADATSIVVEVDAGGTDRIRVVDDGIGMDEEAVRRAVKPHTTSKIRDIDDLERGVETLGFRGEALHTIGAVSRMTIATKPRESEGAGTKLTVVGGSVESVESVGCPSGTAVEVTDLFYNTPARKKFLKTETTEFDHINRIVTRYALGHPSVAVTLEHDGRRVFATTGQGDLSASVLSVYGRDVATSMLSLDDVEVDDGPLEGISGAVSDPETTRASPTYCSIYVNGRAVRSRSLREAMVAAYGKQLAAGRYPFAVLFLSVPPDAVDVNVHPRKMEVRFDHEDGVRAQVRDAVRRTLLDHGFIRSSAPRGRSAPVDAPIDPGSESDAGDGDTDAPPGPAEDEGSHPARPDSAAADGRSGTDRSASTATRAGTVTDGRPGADGMGDSTNTTAGSTGGRGVESGESGEPSGPRPHRESGARFTGPADQTALGDRPNDGFDRLPDLAVLGQIRDTYLVAEHGDGLLLIDQHAADERINYERLRDRFEGETTTQTLVRPVTLELTAREASLFDDFRDALAQLGFAAHREGRTVEVRTVPSVLGDAMAPELLREVLSSFVGGDPEATIDATADALLADLACYPSVTGNTSLTDGSVVQLLEALDGCENPYECPHGRPVLIQLTWDEIEDRFERDYPGHRDRPAPE